MYKSFLITMVFDGNFSYNLKILKIHTVKNKGKDEADVNSSGAERKNPSHDFVSTK